MKPEGIHMRITNQMMTNNCFHNLMTNYSRLNKLNNQYTSQKKITRPSEDPVVAVRALKFRTTCSELEQYLKKNIPDANNWMEVTEGSLNNIIGLPTEKLKNILEEIYEMEN